MKTSLEHLPEQKRRQIQAIAALVQGAATVEMVVLFGSYARGDWVDDPVNGYFSDFDILVVVAGEALAADAALWAEVSRQARAVAGRTPVSIIVHDIKEINHEIRLGQYFFKDIAREGILLYTSRRHTLASPKELAPEEKLRLGLLNFRYWFGSAGEFWRGSGYYAARGLGPHAAFLLHQAVERYYNAVQLIFTDYKAKTHNIETQADQAAPLHPALAGALPRAEGEDKRLFDLLKRGYIDARYSRSYRITAEELRILRERVLDLAGRVRQACGERLASIRGPEAVGELPDVPSSADLADLPEPPSFDDTSAFREWRDAIAALSFDRGLSEGFDRGLSKGKEAGLSEGLSKGKEAGLSEGFDRGKEAGLSEGQKQGKQTGLTEALLTILAARGLPVDPAAQARIEACTDAAVLKRWIARAMTIEAAADLFASDARPS